MTPGTRRRREPPIHVNPFDPVHAFRYGWDMDSSTYVIFAISVIIVGVLAYTDSCRKRPGRGREGDGDARDD